MFRAGIFWALGRLRIKSFGPRVGQSFLYWASGFFRAFVKYKIFLKSQKKSSKYIFKKLLSFLPHFGRDRSQIFKKNPEIFSKKNIQFGPAEVRRAFGLCSLGFGWARAAQKLSGWAGERASGPCPKPEHH